MTRCFGWSAVAAFVIFRRRRLSGSTTGVETVNRLSSLTPRTSMHSWTCEADRHSDPTPNDSSCFGPFPWLLDRPTIRNPEGALTTPQRLTQGSGSHKSSVDRNRGARYVAGRL